MIIPSHIIISNLLYEYLNKELRIPLNRHAFIYGNIKPDLNRYRPNAPHYYPESIDFITKSIRELKENPDLDDRVFSIKLGVICHYLSDYFCLYHHSQKHRQQPLSKHFFYELGLHNKLVQFRSSSQSALKDWLTQYHLDEDIIVCIKRLLKNYSYEDTHMLTDIKYALIASSFVCKDILLVPSIYSKLKPELQYA